MVGILGHLLVVSKVIFMSLFLLLKVILHLAAWEFWDSQQNSGVLFLTHLACRFYMLFVQYLVYFQILDLWTFKIQNILCTSSFWQKESNSIIFQVNRSTKIYNTLGHRYLAYVTSPHNWRLGWLVENKTSMRKKSFEPIPACKNLVSQVKNPCWFVTCHTSMLV